MTHHKKVKSHVEMSDDAVTSDDWLFLRGGIDDSRKGLPPVFTPDTAYYRSCDVIRPNVRKSEGSGRSVRVKAPDKFISGVERRNETIRNIERELQRHPLALYPHLTQSIDPQVYDDVVRILDPQMKDSIDQTMIALTDHSSGSSTSTSSHHSSPSTPHHTKLHNDEISLEKTLRNPYLWSTSRDDDGLDDDGHKKADQPKIQSQAENEEVLVVTKKFCDWVRSMGGDSTDIDETTILSLFASGYDTKPSLSMPIQVVELNSIPPELRAIAGGMDRPGSTASKVSSPQVSDKVGGEVEGSVRYRYGAWYLNPSTWRRMPCSEALKDPKDQTGMEVSEIKQKSLDLDKELSSMHGTRLFMQFVDEKSTRKPEFLENVSRIQQKKVDDQRSKSSQQIENSSQSVVQ